MESRSSARKYTHHDLRKPPGLSGVVIYFRPNVPKTWSGCRLVIWGEEESAVRNECRIEWSAMGSLNRLGNPGGALHRLNVRWPALVIG